MLPKYPFDSTEASVSLKKYSLSGVDLSCFGAFPKGEILRLSVTCPRALGAAAVVLRINRDGEDSRDIPFEFIDEALPSLMDEYELTLDTAALCGEAESGLFFYQLLFVRRADTLFSDSVNNLDFSLSAHGGNAFRLLIHEEDYTAPTWFGEGVMYHVFVDRFCSGAGEVHRREGDRAPEINPNWETGIPQYPPYSGAHLTNHVHFGGNLWGVAE